MIDTNLNPGPRDLVPCSCCTYDMYRARWEALREWLEGPQLAATLGMSAEYVVMAARAKMAELERELGEEK